MKIDLNRLRGAWHVTVHVVRLKRKASSTKVMEKRSITPATIAPEVWIMSGLLLSLAQQIGSVSLRQKQEGKQDIE